MLRQDILILAGFWALLLSPALCEGGLLAHPCDCDEHDVCHHEDGCATDPCVDAVRPDDDGTPLLAPAAGGPAASLAAVQVDPAAPEVLESRHRPPPEPPSFGRPYPDSDLPLLI